MKQCCGSLSVIVILSSSVWSRGVNVAGSATTYSLWGDIRLQNEVLAGGTLAEFPFGTSSWSRATILFTPSSPIVNGYVNPRRVGGGCDSEEIIQLIYPLQQSYFHMVFRATSGTAYFDNFSIKGKLFSVGIIFSNSKVNTLFAECVPACAALACGASTPDGCGGFISCSCNTGSYCFNSICVQGILI